MAGSTLCKGHVYFAALATDYPLKLQAKLAHKPGWLYMAAPFLHDMHQLLCKMH